MKGNWENQNEGILQSINFIGENIVTFNLLQDQKSQSYQKLYKVKKSVAKELILEVYSKDLYSDKVYGDTKLLKIDLSVPKAMTVSFSTDDNKSFILVRKDRSIFH
ncbi:MULTISPECIES: hypothetical protein [unclassified Sphingobacterium]|uniref:hypothetical protein n=1 Tax=unclassified Sphingobacterium TaxID=2609468 RepID=UPI0010496E5A|nr:MULTISPECIES: hypothetical protein [unclassified Sphingobacterium]MCS3552558.1 hypothetical protein [Sphingobacterium sp. JUb21]TCR10680.1 hypothetical protein EDF66_101495 [Sphingobacterium sp. JUb20]